MLRLRYAPAILLMGLAACHLIATESADLPPDGSLVVDLDTDLGQYRLGGAATITMTNRSAVPLLYGGCDDALERQSGGRWVEVRSLGLACPSIGLVLNPAVPVTLPFDLRSANEPGTYRLRRPFQELQGTTSERSYRRSNPFTLTP